MADERQAEGTTNEIRTERLLLRRWRPEDRAPFAALNADPEVVAFLPKPLTRAESDAMIDRIERHFDEHGFGAWAVEAVGKGFIGLVGLAHVGFDAPFVPAVEIGWRLSRQGWGCGYATEAARAALEHGFETLGLEEVVAFAVPANTRSTAVMERIGMTRDPEGDFDHPSLPSGHPLRRHLLYRITAPR